MRKKILFFCGGSYISGMEVVTLHLMKGLKENGYDVRCIFSGWNDGNFKKKLEEINVPNYAVKVGWVYIRKPLWTIDTLVHYPAAYLQCKKIIKNFQPDICQFCNFSMSIMLFRLIKTKAVYNLQETHEASFKNKLIFHLLKNKVDLFIAVSNHIVQVLKILKVPSEKIKLIYNGIPVPESIDKNFNVPIDNSVLNFAIIGQVAIWKGHLLLIDAVETLTERGMVNFTVLIYGNDSTFFANELKKIIQEKALNKYFIWKGFISDQRKLYDECGVVVVPSLSGEPCSLTIIEAMARAKTLIVSDRGGNPELIQHEQNGLIFYNTSSSQLAERMAYCLNNRNAILSLGVAASAKAMAYYTYKNMTSNYIKLYNGM